LSNELYFPEVKQKEPVASNHSPPETVKFKNAWIYRVRLKRDGTRAET